MPEQAREAARRSWRWGIDKPIALLRLEPEDLEKKGLSFEDDYDDLDALRHARLQGPSGRVYALVRHKHSPSRGTEVVTRIDSPDPASDLEEVLSTLHLTPGDLAWTHPDVRKAWASSRLKGLRDAFQQTLALLEEHLKETTQRDEPDIQARRPADIMAHELKARLAALLDYAEKVLRETPADDGRYVFVLALLRATLDTVALTWEWAHLEMERRDL